MMTHERSPWWPIRDIKDYRQNRQMSAPGVHQVNRKIRSLKFTMSDLSAVLNWRPTSEVQSFKTWEDRKSSLRWTRRKFHGAQKQNLSEWTIFSYYCHDVTGSAAPFIPTSCCGSSRRSKSHGHGWSPLLSSLLHFHLVTLSSRTAACQENTNVYACIHVYLYICKTR